MAAKNEGWYLALLVLSCKRNRADVKISVGFYGKSDAGNFKSGWKRLAQAVLVARPSVCQLRPRREIVALRG